MEENVSLNEALTGFFGVEEKDIKSYNPLALAFLGDGVYELIIRTLVTNDGNRSPAKLHYISSSIVKAAAQAKSADRIENILTDEEKDVMRRGKNANSPTRSKNASLKDYRKATGFEALLGYLYLKGDDRRILEVVKYGLGDLIKNDKLVL